MAKAKTKKTARQLDADIAYATLLPADWPAAARRAVESAARSYDRAIHEPFAVPDVELDRAVDDINDDLERLDREHDSSGNHADTLERDGTWHSRYESGRTDAEIRSAIKAWSALVRQRAPRM